MHARSDQTTDSEHAARPRYGTWIRTRRLGVFALLTACCLAATVASFAVRWLAVFAVPTVLFGYISAVLALSIWRLSSAGDDLQRKIHDELITAIGVQPGEQVLDIGCGSGALVVSLALAAPEAHVTGVDLWSDDWEYSEGQAERNARLEGVADRTQFARHSASALPYHRLFDAVTSCLTFHEVRDAADATTTAVSALATLRPGGRFAYLDLFASDDFYPSTRHVVDALTAVGASVHTVTPLADLVQLRFPLGLRRSLGGAVLITGQR